MNKLYQLYSKLNAEFKLLLFNHSGKECKCSNKKYFIKYKFINPKTNLWEYDFVCTDCERLAE